MDVLKKLNKTSDAYQKSLKDPNWKVGKKKDLEDFARGSQQSGNGDVVKFVGGIADKVKRAWGELKK
jgi:hypothetical protein